MRLYYHVAASSHLHGYPFVLQSLDPSVQYAALAQHCTIFGQNVTGHSEAL